MTAISRTAGGKILIPFGGEDGDLIAEGATEIGPDDPRYAEYDDWLTSVEAEADTWTATGQIDTGEQVTITWRDGISDCPADALDWLIAATEAGEVDGSDGAALLAWLETQGFTRQVSAKFDPHERRDEHGRWTRGPGGGTAVAADPEEFTARFEAAFRGSPYTAFVNHYSPQEIRAARMIPLLANDGKTGVLIHDHGDGRIEATALFNTSDVPGAGVAMLRDAIDHHGVNYVECFGPVLPRLYATLGFRDADVYPFDPGQAPADWNTARFDSPDYHTMRLAVTAAAGPPEPDTGAAAAEAESDDPDWWARYGAEALKAARVAFGIDPPGGETGD